MKPIALALTLMYLTFFGPFLGVAIIAIAIYHLTHRNLRGEE